MKHKDIFSDLRVEWSQSQGLVVETLQKIVDDYNKKYAEKEKLFRLYIETSDSDLWNVWSSKYSGEVFVYWDKGIKINTSFVLRQDSLEELQEGFYSIPDFEREYARPYFRYVDFYIGGNNICSFDMGSNIPLSILDTGDKEIQCCRTIQQPYVCLESVKILGLEQENETGQVEGRHNRRLYNDFLKNSRR